MKDNPEEIASVMNLILPLDKQLPTGKNFTDEYMQVNKDNYSVITPDKIKSLKTFLTGRVSYIANMETDVKKEYIGDENIGSLKHFIIKTNNMSNFQSTAYKYAVEEDCSDKNPNKNFGKGNNIGFRNNSREASLFIYPDGSWGKKGFDKYIKKTKTISVNNTEQFSYLLEPSFINLLRGKDNEDTIKNISKYSTKYAYLIDEILKTSDKCWFIYSSIVNGSGIILFSLLLKLVGFSNANGKEKDTGLRYALMTGQNISAAKLKLIQNRFNNPDNAQGKIIQVILGSDAVSEGFSFMNIQREAIITPHWNFSETSQALARGMRLGSHDTLKKIGIKPELKIILTTSIPNSLYLSDSVELYLYQMSENKDISIKSIIRVIMEASFDCALNYFRNHREGFENKRECDYTDCDYKCDFVDMDSVRKGLENKELDYSTYQLYYTNPKTREIYKKIEELLYSNALLSFDSILQALKSRGYTEWEIISSLQTLIDENKNNISYTSFKKTYKQSTTKELIFKIRDIFKVSFSLDLNIIVEKLKNFTLFEILTALKQIINQSVPIKNKYGFISYLRETNDIYYLVDCLSSPVSLFSSYYTRYPNITTNKTIDTIINNMNSKRLPDTINRLFTLNKNEDFKNLLDTIPLEIQEQLLEMSIVAELHKIQKNSNYRDKLIKLYSNYIQLIDTTWSSTLLLEQHKTIRCFDGKKVKDWYNCNLNYLEIIKNFKKEQIDKIRNKNNTGIYGKYNSENGKFCISISKQDEDKQDDVDTRTKRPGTVCDQGGLKKPQLLSIIVKRLKIPCVDEYRKKDSLDDLKTLINKNKSIYKNVYEHEDINKLNEKELRNILYWGGFDKKIGVKDMCSVIKKWFLDNNLLEEDNQCGTTKKQRLEEKKEKPEINVKNISIKKIIELNDVNTYTIPMNNILTKWFKKDYKNINYKNWYIALYKNKIVIVAKLSDDKQKLEDVAASEYYLKKDNIANISLRYMMKYTGVLYIQFSKTTDRQGILEKNYNKLGLDVHDRHDLSNIILKTNDK